MEINSDTSKPAKTGEIDFSNAQRPGEYLQQIRVKQGKELSDVAKELKINVKQLIALEADDYKSLPEAPFVKGYYRTYAKFLNVDSDALIQRFEEIYSSATGLPASHALKDSPIKMMGRLASSGHRGINKWLWRTLWLLLLIVLLWGAWVMVNGWMAKRQVNEVEQYSTTTVEELPVHTGAGVLTPVSENLLYLEFSAPTSVMIKDADGKILAQGRQASNLQLTGQPPFSIRLDDASVVKLKLNNERIALLDYTNTNGSADFQLAP